MRLAGLFCVVSLALNCFAQESSGRPDSPSHVAGSVRHSHTEHTKASTQKPSTQRFLEPKSVQLSEQRTHKFFDRTNVLLTGMTAAATFADGLTTQRVNNITRLEYVNVNGTRTLMNVSYSEQNPIARPFVNQGWPGQAAACALTVGADLAVRGLLHRSGHHRLERILPFAFAATSATFAARNSRYW